MGKEMGGKRQQKKEREKSIRESKYNRWYKEIVEEGIPAYLKEGRKQENWRRVTRFRLGNERGTILDEGETEIV